MPEFSGEGEIIPDSHCPKCNSPLEYNGNYWCSELTCKYIMPEQMTLEDKKAFNIAYVLLMKQTGREPQMSALYLEVL